MENKYKLGIIILLLVIVIIVGIIIILNITSQKVVCNKPYILVGTSCCLDINDNSICDKDETISQPFTTSLTTSEKTTAFVSKVIDGDSIELQDKTEVRLLGINTPERGQPYYKEATDRLRELVEGKNVILEGDVRDKDQYDRLLRYIFIDDLFVNLQMVKEGYAQVYIIEPNTKYETSLRNAQNEAKEQKLNIWKQPSTGENICDNRCIGISWFKWDADGYDCDNLNDEYVTLINTCSYSCDLTGWSIKDEANHIYAFSSFVLDGSKTVTIYTGAGTNTKTDLYWSRIGGGKECSAIWNNNGDTLYLRNSNGELVLDYSYNMSQ